jgi:hypothetical protein
MLSHISTLSLNYIFGGIIIPLLLCLIICLTSWIPASASRSSVSDTANKTHLDPCSSGTGTVCVQNHEPECSSMVSSWARTEPGTENTYHMSFSQFDVVQDFSDHHYAKTSAGKVCCHFVNPFFWYIRSNHNFPPHNVWPGHQRLGESNPKWMEPSTEKPTWSVYAGYILSIFCFLFLPNYHKL